MALSNTGNSGNPSKGRSPASAQTANRGSVASSRKTSPVGQKSVVSRAGTYGSPANQKAPVTTRSSFGVGQSPYSTKGMVPAGAQIQQAPRQVSPGMGQTDPRALALKALTQLGPASPMARQMQQMAPQQRGVTVPGMGLSLAPGSMPIGAGTPPALPGINPGFQTPADFYGSIRPAGMTPEETAMEDKKARLERLLELLGVKPKAYRNSGEEGQFDQMQTELQKMGQRYGSF